jgi:hypothetical protein
MEIQVVKQTEKSETKWHINSKEMDTWSNWHTGIRDPDRPKDRQIDTKIVGQMDKDTGKQPVIGIGKETNIQIDS